ncbi:LAME_0D04874g1_1 [Lachancea meyersii CBS 8951]|uniref:LAME_0D04874g1_1 n=1 Tax=Lachancea meyersii CBS 8951 TaxID=1266667 RepID=A0A1G4J8D3_9SACH|nr:LAME_0D04874g1_1 [Lachancea meyersii CBS 8951]
MEAKPCFISLIDHNDRPLLVFVAKDENTGNDVEFKFNTFSNMALDYFSSDLYEWMNTSQENREIKDLFQLEGVAVYGKLVKQTSLKIVVGFWSQSECGHETLGRVFNEISRLYVRCKFNPFLESNEDLIEQLQKTLSERF